MKKGIILLAVSLFLSVWTVNAQTASEIIWLTNFEEAKKEAKSSNKTLLLNFTGSDWCGWCIRLHNEVFAKPEFAEYAKNNLVCVKLDFPRRTVLDPTTAQQNEQLAQRFSITGFPTIILADGEGSPIARTGYQAGGPENYVKHLQGFISQK